MELTTYLIGAALIVIPLWKIFEKAGMSPGTSLLILIPYAGSLIVLLILAFADWPSVGRSQEPTSSTSIEHYD